MLFSIYQLQLNLFGLNTDGTEQSVSTTGGGHWGLLKPQNRRKKIIQNCKTVKKNCSKPITACKTIKTNKVSHSSYPNPNRSNTEVKSGAKRDFRSYERSVEAKNCRSDRRKTEKQKKKIENHIEYQIRKTNAKKWKICKPQLTLQPQNRKTDLKDFQNRKIENSNAPSYRGDCFIKVNMTPSIMFV